MSSATTTTLTVTPSTTTNPFALSRTSLDSINQIVLFVTQIEEIGLSSFQLYSFFQELHSQLTTSINSSTEQSTSSINSILNKLPKKNLKLTLSDVNKTRTWIGLEFSPIPWLQLNLPKGSKLRIKSAKVFKNMLLLTSQNTTLLTKGPDITLKEWVQVQLSSLKEKIKVEPPSSFSSTFSDNQNQHIDPQAHRFLIDPPKPEDFLPLHLPSIPNSGTTTPTTAATNTTITPTSAFPFSSSSSTHPQLKISNPSNSNSTNTYNQQSTRHVSSSISSTIPTNSHFSTNISSSSPHQQITTVTTPIRSSTPVIVLESDMEDEPINEDVHDDWEDFELSEAMLAQIDEFHPSISSSSSSIVPPPVPPLLTIQEIQSTLLTKIRVQNVKISKKGTKVQRSPFTQGLESWVSIEDGTGSVSIHFDSMVLPQFMNTQQFDVTRDQHYVLEFKKKIKEHFQQGAVLEKIHSNDSQGNGNQSRWKLILNKD